MLCKIIALVKFSGEEQEFCKKNSEAKISQSLMQNLSIVNFEFSSL